jgi:hypothetical protein
VSILAYKPSAEEVLSRLRLLYERRAPDRIFAAMEVPSRALARFREQYPAGYCDYPDPSARAEFWDRVLAERRAVADDAIPSAYLSELDQGLYGAVRGAAVRPGPPVVPAVSRPTGCLQRSGGGEIRR